MLKWLLVYLAPDLAVKFLFVWHLDLCLFIFEFAFLSLQPLQPSKKNSC